MTKGIVSIAIAACAALMMSGCAADEADGGENKKETVVLSTGIQFAPMGFVEADELVGFDIDLGTALGEEAGYEVKWQKSLFNQFLSDVKSQRSDGIMGAMLDTPERQQSITWVDYLESGFQFFTIKDVYEKQSIEEISDLCGKTVAASRNSSYKESIKNWSDDNCDGKSISVFDTDGSPDALLQLKQGRAQAVMQTSEAIGYMAANDDDIVPIGDPITTSYYGLGFAKNDTETRDDFQNALDQLIDDGSYEEIAEKWGIKGQALDHSSVDLEDR